MKSSLALITAFVLLVAFAPKALAIPAALIVAFLAYHERKLYRRVHRVSARPGPLPLARESFMEDRSGLGR